MIFKYDPKPDDPKVSPDWQAPTIRCTNNFFKKHYSVASPSISRQFHCPARGVRPSFRPDMSKNGDVIVAAIMKRWREGDFVRIWFYPKGDLFIVSDDDFTLAAAERGRTDFCPCWVLGEIKNDEKVEQVQGPISQVGLHKIQGLA